MFTTWLICPPTGSARSPPSSAPVELQVTEVRDWFGADAASKIATCRPRSMRSPPQEDRESFPLDARRGSAEAPLSYALASMSEDRRPGSGSRLEGSAMCWLFT